MDSYDLVVIGGGPGGYIGAIRASQLGLKTALVEKRETLGGTCMNVGCIPTKALLESSEVFYKAQNEMEEHGVIASNVSADLKTMMARKDTVVSELVTGIAFLMKKNKIKVYSGHGKIIQAGNNEFKVQVGETTIETKACIIATGSVPMEIPSARFDGTQIIHSDQGISMEEIPERLAILGGGVIGLELGSVWQRLGSRVTIIEMLPDILSPLDRQLRENAKRAFKKQGLEILTDHKLTGTEANGSELKLFLETGKGEQKEITAEKLLVAVGRKPYTENLGLESTGIQLDQAGRIQVDPATLQTSIPGLYAIGDVIHGPMLAHKAEEEGVFVAEQLAGLKAHINYDTVPFVVYTSPEIAWVGKSEETLKSEGRECRTGKFLFRVNGRAKAAGQTDGMVKIIADAKSDKILGGFIVGSHASELLSEIVVAMEHGATAESLARSFHAHPTLSEAIKEAALDVHGRALNA